MKRLFPIALTTALLLLLLSGSVMAQEGPRAVVPEPVKDFDFVPQGKVIVHSFEIRNEGDAQLELTDVNPACGCTVVDFDKVIAPGASGQITTRVKTQDFSGPIAKSVAVFTNDANNAKLQLVIKANVKPYLRVFPGFARYSYVQGEYVEAIPQNLWAEDGSDLEILEVSSPYDYLKVSFHEATEAERDARGSAAKQWRVNIKLEPNAPVGALRNFVRVTTNHPEQRIAKIPVSGFIRPRQHVTPETVEFGSLGQSLLPVKRQLAMTNFITKAITIDKVETGLVGLEAEVTEIKNNEGHRFRVLLTVGEGMPEGQFSSMIKIHTSDSKNPIVEVPVTGTITSSNASAEAN